ncbi:RusA family crossover junction endodeoxyribonuclease [Elioraea tepidiphila]|uniref:RusA family crossover junction endodeoxyribonuclease n=1 Tax=Elioraea tepidiphila TaxID=457934 RepID=UPI002FD8AFF8
MPRKTRPPLLQEALGPEPPGPVEVRFTVPGRPVPKARPRFGTGGRVFTPAATIAAERAVASAAWQAWPREAAFSARPVEIDATFRYAVPRSWPKHRRLQALSGALAMTSGADVDNLAKTVLDGLNGGPIIDDAAVVALAGRKAWAAEDGTDVVVRILPVGASPAFSADPETGDNT